MRKSLVAGLGLAILAAGCGGSGGNGGDGGPGGPTGPVGATRVEVSLNDRFTIRPTPMTVAAGVPVTFVVTNPGTLVHQFYIGDLAAQQAREEEMATADGNGEDSPEGLVLLPGETKELVITLEAGTFQAACHIPKHYGRGMWAPVNVVE